MIETTYTLDNEEYVDYCYYLALQDKTIASKRRMTYFGLPVLALCICAILKPPWWVYAVSALLSFFPSVFLMNKVFRAITKKQTKDYLKKQKSHSFVEMKLSITENEIILKQKGKAKENYKLLNYVIFEKIIILICDKSNLIIPIRVYDSKDKIAPLIAYLEENLKNRGEKG